MPRLSCELRCPDLLPKTPAQQAVKGCQETTTKLKLLISFLTSQGRVLGGLGWDLNVTGWAVSVGGLFAMPEKQSSFLTPHFSNARRKAIFDRHRSQKNKGEADVMGSLLRAIAKRKDTKRNVSLRRPSAKGPIPLGTAEMIRGSRWMGGERLLDQDHPRKIA